MENDYYVYIYLDPRKSGKYVYDDLQFENEPFYVGKGRGYRIYEHLRETRYINSYKINKINKIKKEGDAPIIRKIYENLSEKEAFLKEKEIILKIGRLKNGPLVNFSDGGEGQSGYKHKKSDKEKISVGVKMAFKNMDPIKEKNRRKNISKALMGHKGHVFQHSDESKEKIKNAKMAEKNPFYRKTHSEDLKEKWKKERNGIKNSNSVKYVIKEPDENIINIFGGNELKEYSKKKNISYLGLLKYGKSKKHIIVQKIKIYKK
jgi:hypothetical protein